MTHFYHSTACLVSAPGGFFEQGLQKLCLLKFRIPVFNQFFLNHIFCWLRYVWKQQITSGASSILFSHSGVTFIGDNALKSLKRGEFLNHKNQRVKVRAVSKNWFCFACQDYCTFKWQMGMWKLSIILEDSGWLIEKKMWKEKSSLKWSWKWWLLNYCLSASPYGLNICQMNSIH